MRSDIERVQVDSIIVCFSFGRSLHGFREQLEQERGQNSVNTQMLEVGEIFQIMIDIYLGYGQYFFHLQRAFSLMCYPDPWNSSVGDQLDPAGREPVCAQLNSAILGNILTAFF